MCFDIHVNPKFTFQVAEQNSRNRKKRVRIYLGRAVEVLVRGGNGKVPHAPDEM